LKSPSVLEIDLYAKTTYAEKFSKAKENQGHQNAETSTSLGLW